MKKITAFTLALALVFSMFAAIPLNASAASWPSTSSSAYCEFTAPQSINVYRNSSLTTRGTASPAKSYNAYIDRGDVCKIYSVTGSYVYLAYPTSSGYKCGYIRTRDLFRSTSPTDSFVSRARATTYKYAGSSSYGYVDVNDRVYATGTNGNYVQVIYEARSGSRRFKLGYVSSSDFAKMKGNSGGNSNNATVSSSAIRYPMDNMYVCGNNWASYYSKRPSRPYHVGIDVASSNGKSAVYSVADGTVAASGWNSSNGNFIIIKHNIGGRNVYSFYAHLSSRYVSKGNSVRCGTHIGNYGNTGSASAGTHLHFAFVDTLWSNGSYYGYVSGMGNNKATYGGVTYYNPMYVIKYNRLP